MSSCPDRSSRTSTRQHALASARKVARCEIRELEPNVVSVASNGATKLASVVRSLPVPDLLAVDT